MLKKIRNLISSFFTSPKALESRDTMESIVLEALNAQTAYEEASKNRREAYKDPTNVWVVSKVVNDYNSSRVRFLRARDRFLILLRTIEGKTFKSAIEVEVLKRARVWIYDSAHYEALCLEYAKYEEQDVEGRFWARANERAILLEKMVFARGNKENTHRELLRLFC